MNWNSVDLCPALDELFPLPWEIRSQHIQHTSIFITDSIPQGGVVPLLEEISLDSFSNLESVFRNILGVALSLCVRACCCFTISDPTGDADY